LLPLDKDRPVLVIVAGPNGSGKSTAYENVDLELEGRSIRIVNPDLLAKRILVEENLSKEDANLLAVTRIRSWLDASVEVYQTVGVETVLSTDKYRDLVADAKSRGFEIWLMFVCLDTPDRNVERVNIRVKKGGHAVRPDKIHSRYWRSLLQMPWFLEKADRGWIWDNSGADAKLVGVKTGASLEIDPSCPRNVIKALNGTLSPGAEA
jgi:predicted ABC-type ATPase